MPWLFGLAVLAVIAIVLIVVLFLTLSPTGPPRLPTPGEPTSEPERPEAQSPDCPDVLTLVVPGTWESNPDDDPTSPTANPNSLMLRVSSALQQDFEPSRNTVYTVPYVAQFRNPTNLGDRQRDYDYSRSQGYDRAAAKLASMNRECPLTSYLLMGFSQGAVIVGDLASNIGNGRGPIPQSDADLVLGVGLIADGRREPGGQNDVGPSPDGVGAEIALGAISGLVPGITMNGPRSGGFGVLTERTYSICAPGDLICDAPTAANPLQAIGKLTSAMGNPVHALYATDTHWSADGASATQWMYGWSRSLVEQAPHPAHY